MTPMTFLCSSRMEAVRIIAFMLPSELTQDHTRTLTLVLPESEWRALRDIEPDAVAWLQLQIRDRLTGNAVRPSSPLPMDDSDDY